MADFANTFNRHEIRDRVIAPHFGSWRLMRRTESGGWTGVFWCRITAADGLLRVSGDFDPIVFQGHLSHEDDPIERVAWMGSHEGLDSYVCEKARSGSGRDACTRWSTDDARADLEELIAEREAELRAECEEEHGPDESQWPDDELCCSAILAMQAGLDAYLQYDGREGVQEILEAIHNSPHAIEMEDVCTIGGRPSSALKLAHLAVRRLHALLCAEAAADTVTESADVPNVLGLPEGYKYSLAGPVPVDVDTSAMTGAQVVAAMNRVHGAERYVWVDGAVRDTRGATIVFSGEPPKHSIPADVVTRATEACYRGSTLAYGYLQADIYAALHVLLCDEYLGPSDPLQRWPESVLKHLGSVCETAFHEWLAIGQAPRSDDENKHAAVAFIVDALAGQVDAAYRSTAYAELLPVAVLLGARLNMVRSERAPVEGMWDVLATWPDESTAQVAWDENASVDEVAAALSEARHA